MSVEQKRQCGFRKVNGLYLCGEGIAVGCDRLPKNIECCPTCGSGVHFSQGFQWINGAEFFKEKCEGDSECHRHHCFLCVDQKRIEKCGLMFIGDKFYSPASFIKEAKKLGVSKRIAYIPKDLELGKTYILLAHQKAGKKEIEDKTTLTGKRIVDVPAVFYAFVPKRIEQITPIPVPDDDIDHKGNVYEDLRQDKKLKDVVTKTSPKRSTQQKNPKKKASPVKDLSTGQKHVKDAPLKAEFAGTILITGKKKHRWECPKCREEGRMVFRFILSPDKDGVEYSCRSCKTKLLLKRRNQR